MTCKNILVQVDPRNEEDIALEHAVRLAKQHDAKLKLFDVLPDFAWPLQFIASDGEKIVEKVTGGKRQSLKQLADSLQAQGINATSVMGDGRSSVAMIREVISDDHDLVVKLAKGRFSNRSGFFGSTAIRLLRKCPCPVLVIKNEHVGEFTSVSVAVDVLDGHEIQRELNERVIDTALEIARPSSLDLVYALPDQHFIIPGDELGMFYLSVDQSEEMHRNMTTEANDNLNALGATIDKRGVSARPVIIKGRPEMAIPDYVEDQQNDLLVMGTLGRSGMEGFLLGNTAERMLSRVKSSVLAVKPAGFVTPIRVKK